MAAAAKVQRRLWRVLVSRWIHWTQKHGTQNFLSEGPPNSESIILTQGVARFFRFRQADICYVIFPSRPRPSSGAQNAYTAADPHVCIPCVSDKMCFTDTPTPDSL